ncbi:MAG: type II toxin-antitoxin system RelE/ParE family toxin [Bacteroidales bacterium]|jgi:plasmid stabilization system protein ParE|nr:type II toxin-antitoxin system RelE/ParE family toxin [Bacteroidales bacterium]
MYTLFYLDAVRDDILNAKQWYAEQQKGLDEKFVAAIKDAIANIIKMPAAYAVRYKNVRIAHTRVFPYNIHFFIDEEKEQIILIGVVHQKRKDALFIDR